MITAKEYSSRRKKILSQMAPKSAMILFSGCEVKASEDASHDFWVNRNFFYLSGITQANCILLLVKYSNTRSRSILLIDAIDEHKVKWTGKMVSKEEAKKISGCESIIYKNQEEPTFANEELVRMFDIVKCKNFYLDLDEFLYIEPGYTTRDFKEELVEDGNKVKDAYEMIIRLRMIKSPAEVEMIKDAVHVTNLGLQEILKKLEPGKYEYQMSSLFEYFVRDYNNSGLSFPTIAVSGDNGWILHYPTPNEKMEDGKLILFDLGSEKGLYRSDISRTYPINGKFTLQQKDIYEMVLRCNRAVKEYMKPGVTLRNCQDFAFDYLKGELLTHGYISPKKAHELATEEMTRMMEADPTLVLTEQDKSDIYFKKLNEQVSKYYYHSVSHHLGLDCHDASLRDLPLEPGNVISDEPGLYMKEYGIGIRIEDDILITESGSVCLSEEIIKDVKDIEDFMANNK